VVRPVGELDRLTAPMPSGWMPQSSDGGERVLGIVGGVRPESTADYYRRLIGCWRARGPANTLASLRFRAAGSRSASPSPAAS
jgi:hypothetical protein